MANGSGTQAQPQMPMVQVFAPDGTLGDIPYDKLHDAISAGAKIAAKVKAPDGTVGFIPGDRVPEAMKAGATRVPLDLSDADGGKDGFWQQGWKNLNTPRYDRVPGGGEEMRIAQGAPVGAEILGGIGTAGAGLEAAGIIGGAGPSLAPLAPLVRGALGSAGGGFVGREIGKPFGQENLGGQIGAVAGGIYGAGGGKIPTNASELEESLLSPEAKARAAQEIEGQETVDATKMQDVYNRRVAREQAAADKATQKAALTPQATPAKPIPKGTNYGQYLEDQKAAAKVAATQPPSPIVTSQSPEIPSEGRPATWKNLSVSDLASKGGPLTFDAAKQAQLRQLDVPNVGLVADPRATVGGAGLGSSAERLARLRQIAYPDLPGGPGDFASKAAEPQWLYRTRDVGEKGIPNESRPNMTSSLDQAKSWLESRNEGTPQEIVRVDANSLKPEKLQARPYSDSVNWYRHEGAIPEDQVQVVVPHQDEVESQ